MGKGGERLAGGDEERETMKEKKWKGEVNEHVLASLEAKVLAKVVNISSEVIYYECEGADV